MEKKLVEFLCRDNLVKDAYDNGLDLYAFIASKIYHNNYEDNLEFRDGEPFPEGKIRRTNTKILILSAFVGETSFLKDLEF